MTKITRRFEFDMGHRVHGHESKCAYLHGHRYCVNVTCTAPSLDAIGRVIDFSVIKSAVGTWIDANWDHNVMLHEDDPLLHAYVPDGNDTWEDWASRGLYEKTSGLAALNPFSGPLAGLTSRPIFNGRMPYVVPNGENTTAEIIAKILFENASRLLNDYGITVVSVCVDETPNCWAEYNLEMHSKQSR